MRIGHIHIMFTEKCVFVEEKNSFSGKIYSS